MPIPVRKLSSDEATRFFPKRGQMDLTEYVEALRPLQVGEAAEVRLEGLTARALKRRLGQAARQRGWVLRWARDSGGDALRFQVREAPQARGTGGGRRGRRRANAA